MTKILKETCIIFLISSGIALVFNSFYPEGIPLLAPYPYEIYTDCAEFTEHAEFISMTGAINRIFDKKTIFVDARSPEEFEKGHIKGAENIAYDVLFPVSEGQISLIKGRDLIIIYDDAPSESEFRPAATFASELKSKGIKNVKYMKERFSDWKKKGFPVE